MRDLGLTMKMGPIIAIRKGSPAQAAGFEIGDMMQEVNGEPVGDPLALSQRLAPQSEPAEPITFTVERDGKLLDFKVRPELRDPIIGEPPKEKSSLGRVADWIFGRPPLRHAGIYGPGSTRVAIVLPNSPAAEAGIQVGDRITAIDGKRFTHPSELETHIKSGGAVPVPLEPVEQRRADALVALVEGAAVTTELVIHVDAELLADPATDGCCFTEHGQPVTAHAARRSACDASIRRLVVGSDGEPLNVDRRTRVVPTALRRALAARDRGCVFPGCGATSASVARSSRAASSEPARSISAR